MPEPLDLPLAAEVARRVLATGDEPGLSWLKEVRVTVVLGRPGAADTEHTYGWAMES